MKNQKFFRLFLGIVILFSVVLFQGTKSHDSCDESCDELRFGYVNVYNHTIFDLKVIFWGGQKGIKAEYSFTVGAGQIGKRVTLEPGLYGAFAYKLVNGIKLTTRASNYQYIYIEEGSTVNYHVY